MLMNSSRLPIFVRNQKSNRPKEKNMMAGCTRLFFVEKPEIHPVTPKKLYNKTIKRDGCCWSQEMAREFFAGNYARFSTDGTIAYPDWIVCHWKH